MNQEIFKSCTSYNFSREKGNTYSIDNLMEALEFVINVGEDVKMALKETNSVSNLGKTDVKLVTGAFVGGTKKESKKHSGNSGSTQQYTSKQKEMSFLWPRQSLSKRKNLSRKGWLLKNGRCFVCLSKLFDGN